MVQVEAWSSRRRLAGGDSKFFAAEIGTLVEDKGGPGGGME